MRSEALHSLACHLRGRRILVTGAAGFIGRNLVGCLTDAGCEVHALLRPNGQRWRLQDLMAGHTAHFSDVGDHESLEPVFHCVKPQVVFHLAVPRGNDSASRDEMLRVNVVGAHSLMQCVRRHGVQRLVVAGSSLEYSPSATALQEDSPANPITWHGATKAAATVLYRQGFLEFGLPVVMLRIFHVYGPWESSHRLLPTAIRSALNDTPMPMTEPGIRRDWVHVQDVCEALLLAATQASPGEVFNIGTGVETTNEDLVALVQEILGRPIKLLPGQMPMRATDAAHRFADSSRASQRLGWLPRHSLADGVRQTVAWHALNPGAWSNPADRWAGAA